MAALLLRSLLCVCAFLVVTAPAVAQRLSEGWRHLGVVGQPEWDTFARSQPHGPQLELRFTGTENPAESTLLIEQRNVKAAWAVVLNGRRLGTLETLHQPLVKALGVPPGLVRAGENRLVISRLTSGMRDDIEVGEISLQAMPLTTWLKQATIDVEVSDDSGQPSPCRVTLTDLKDVLMPLLGEARRPLAVRTGVVYTGDGRVGLRVAPGTYRVYASRGFEFGVDTADVTVAAGSIVPVRLTLRREVPTPGFIAADTHIHTLTHSRHGDATLEERMLTIAGEGIELAVSTEHNHHADYSMAAAASGLSAHFRTVVGNEVSTKAGHFNAFPVPANGRVPDSGLTDWRQLLHHIRTVTGAQVITLNHPRDVHQGFTPFGADVFDPATGELRGADQFDFDAIEVVTSAAMQSDILQLYRDWFALLNRGFRVAALGASDTHQVSEYILGQARTYVASSAASVEDLDLQEIFRSFRSGRLLVSMGLLTHLQVDGRYGSGDLVRPSGSSLEVEVSVLGPSWVRADRVELYANGLLIREAGVNSGPAVEKARLRWTLPRPAHDVHLVAIASGPGVTAPFWETPPPYQASSPTFTPRVLGSTNPVWIDADADGDFTSARGYAKRLWADRQKGAPLDAARAYDAAVQLHLEDLGRRVGEAGR